ncbi:DNA damage-inducible protein 1, partial [Zancudomyces culisetae]
MNVPKVFLANTGTDPEEWIEEFRLMAKLNKWSKEDWIDFVKLYLGNNEKIWYKKFKSDISSWDIFVELFKKKFAIKKSKSQVWDRLREIKQSEFDTIEELELELESLLDMAEITSDGIRTDWLTSTLQPKYKKILEDENITGWSNIITRILKEEKKSPLSHNKSTNKEMDSKPREYSRNAASKSGKNVKEVVKDQKPFGQFLKMFDELIDFNKPRYFGPRKLVCYHCQKEGHSKYQCPLLEGKNNPNTVNKESEKSVNFIQISDDTTEDPNEVFAVDKRKNNPENENEVPKRVGRPRLQELDQSQVNRQSSNRKDNSISATITSSETGNINSSKPFSLVEELEKISLKVNVLQLLDNSTSMKEELVKYIQNKKPSEVNEFDVEERKLSNCKTLVKVFGQSLWAVVDTGAACSVVTTNLVEEWGLSPDNYNKQVIVTADGKRHTTIGRVSEVPLKISSFSFPANLWVMDRNEDILILGTDWLLEHRVSLNLAIPEMRLPIDHAEITTKLATHNKKGNYTSEQEIYLLLKEDVQMYETEYDTEFKNIVEDFKDIF